VRLSPHSAPSVQSSRPLDDLALVQGSSSEELAQIGLKPDHQCPFGPVPLQNLQPYYEHFCPCAPHRYSGSCGVSHLSFSLSIGTTGSHVPCQSLIQVHAAFTPDTGRAISRLASTFIPGHSTDPGFDVIYGNFDASSAVHFRSSPWISPDAIIAAPFPATLTTKALYPSSLRWFEISSCKPTPGGPPPSSAKHPHPCALPPFCNTGGSVRDTRAA
jgi:hypothetical protein